MHIHILGICGTFMGGLALLARSLGHRVTGSDQHVYPPMSTLLQTEGVEIKDGYEPQHLQPAPDLVVVGNAMSRGRPIVEYLLDSGLAYTSGPQWLGEHVLSSRSVIAVAGTHGKTTTSSMLAWILDQAGADPGYLIGGVPDQLGVSARLGSGPWFVVEADEYDTAFFDKRSKFVHYRPDIAILNNLEFDHADIFDDIEAIKKQFHHLVRTIPSTGYICVNADDQNLAQVLDMGCWTPVQYFLPPGTDTDAGSNIAQAPDTPRPDITRVRLLKANGSEFQIVQSQQHSEQPAASVQWKLIGNHNVANGLAAAVAAQATGVSLDTITRALCEFRPSRRRLELKSTTENRSNILVYDDFAHHPTAIKTTLEALRANAPQRRLIAVVELRSNTMQLGVHHDQLMSALDIADTALVYSTKPTTPVPADTAAIASATDRTTEPETIDDYAELQARLKALIQRDDQIVFMSNGSFDGIADRISRYVDALD